MKHFKLPPLSPLSGSSLRLFFRLLRTYHVDRQHYPKVVFTFLLLLVATPFQWIDRLFFARRIGHYRLEEPPLFILGHWRSGTTLLHNLLALDPAAGFVTTYHAVFPHNLKSAWLFGTFMRIFMPRHRPGDQLELAVHLPQEDEYALSNLTHRSYYHFFYFPWAYEDFYDRYVRFAKLSQAERENWRNVYRNLVVRAAIDRGGKRMVLKNPINTGRIPMLLEIFPDARFVFLVRNPVEVYLSSVKFFTQLFPTLNLGDFSRAQIREMVLNTCEKLLRDYLAHHRLIPKKNLLEIRYEQLLADPLHQLARIYDAFGMRGYQQIAPSFSSYLDSQTERNSRAYRIYRTELDRVVDRLGFAMDLWNYRIPADLQVIEEAPEVSNSSWRIT